MFHKLNMNKNVFLLATTHFLFALLLQHLSLFCNIVLIPYFSCQWIGPSVSSNSIRQRHRHQPVSQPASQFCTKEFSYPRAGHGQANCLAYWSRYRHVQMWAYRMAPWLLALSYLADCFDSWPGAYGRVGFPGSAWSCVARLWALWLCGIYVHSYLLAMCRLACAMSRVNIGACRTASNNNNVAKSKSIEY